jgi:hypothetical protein
MHRFVGDIAGQHLVDKTLGMDAAVLAKRFPGGRA